MRPEHEANYLPPSSTENKNEWSFTSIPLYALMACIGRVLFTSQKKCQDSNIRLDLYLVVSYSVIGLFSGYGDYFP